MVREILQRVFREDNCILGSSPLALFQGVHNSHFYSRPMWTIRHPLFSIVAKLVVENVNMDDMPSLTSSSLEFSSCPPVSFLLLFSPVVIQVKLSSSTFPLTHPFSISQHSLSLPSSVPTEFWFGLDIHPPPHGLALQEGLTHSYSQRLDSDWWFQFAGQWLVLAWLLIGLGQRPMNKSVLWASRKSFLILTKSRRKILLSFCLGTLPYLGLIPGISTFWPR